MSEFKRPKRPPLRWRRLALLVLLVGVAGAVGYFWQDLCLARAEACLTQRDAASAKTWLLRSSWLTAKDTPHAALLRLRTARKLQDFAAVEQGLKEARLAGAPVVEVERERLLAMAQTGQFQGLAGRWPELLNDSREDVPEIARAYYQWSMVSHRLDDARRVLELWHDDLPKDPEPLLLLGRYFQATLNWEGAEDAYAKALALSPKDDDCRLAFAEVLTTRLKSTAAIPHFREYLQRHPGNSRATQGLAQCLASSGEVGQGVDLLREAVKAHPDDFFLLKGLGELLLLNGEAQGAVAPLQKAHAMVPEHARLADTLARALKASGHPAEAKPLFDFVAESRPHLDELLVLERRLRTEPDNLEARTKIAEITAKYVSRQDAIRWYRMLLTLAPNHAPAQSRLRELERQSAGASPEVRPRAETPASRP